ncbi:MAG TPA: DNA-formamidopyrimidine glycosylase family protein, partial [Dongiaceae bacterium]|nr:DNA-formamidopyrimidine glycosylase family protein [Dongiaceae bacterium]
MPELPEVEVLVRHLAPLLQNRTIREVHVHRPKVLLPTSPRELQERLSGARFLGLTRRGKYLLFALRGKGRNNDFSLVGHLGMTGRMYLQPAKQSLPKHAAVVLRLGRENFIYEDQRYFGRLTLAVEAVAALGPEPFEAEFTPTALAQALQRSTRPVKVKLLDQELVAGVGNIYASEALFRAGI